VECHGEYFDSLEEVERGRIDIDYDVVWTRRWLGCVHLEFQFGGMRITANLPGFHIDEYAILLSS
jgi:hypothetical protein